MRFEWQVNDGVRIVDVRLRPRFVPDVFFDLLDRRGTELERPDDRRCFDGLKRDLSERVWSAPLAQSFEVHVRPARVASRA